jgi:hypothetical protein
MFVNSTPLTFNGIAHCTGGVNATDLVVGVMDWKPKHNGPCVRVKSLKDPTQLLPPSMYVHADQDAVSDLVRSPLCAHYVLACRLDPPPLDAVA